MNSEYSDKDNDEIDILELIVSVWSQKKTVFKFVFVFMIVGIFIAVFTKNEYEASVTLVPQVGESNQVGGLGGLAAMAGINVGGSAGNSDIPPILYSKITGTVPFKRSLLNSLIKVDGVSKEISFKEYYESYNNLGVLYYIKKYTIGLPGVLISTIRGKKEVVKESVSEEDGIYRVSSSESSLFGYINQSLSFDINDKEGVVTIKFSMPEALASAQMVKATQKLLQKEIVKFKIEKSQSDYNFILQTYKDSKKDFLKKQFALANYRDRHQGLILSKSKSRLERLQTDYNLASNLYFGLAKELSSQKIELKENTPIFTVIEPVSVPLKSKPRRGFIFVIWVFLGFVMGIGYVLGRGFVNDLRNR